MALYGLTDEGLRTVRALLDELDLDPNDDDNVEAFVGNHGATLINDAAAGDVQALVELRTKCGLPFTR